MSKPTSAKKRDPKPVQEPSPARKSDSVARVRPILSKERLVKRISGLSESEILPELEQLVQKARRGDPLVELLERPAVGAGGAPLSRKRRPGPSAPHRSLSILELVDDVLQYPDAWLDTPNEQFDGRKPRDLIGSKEEVLLRNLLNAVDQGLF